MVSASSPRYSHAQATWHIACSVERQHERLYGRAYKQGGNRDGICHNNNRLKWAHGSHHLSCRDLDLERLTGAHGAMENLHTSVDVKQGSVTAMTQSSTVARRGSDPSLIWLSADNSPMTAQVLSQLTRSTPVASASPQRAALSLTTGSAAPNSSLFGLSSFSV